MSMLHAQRAQTMIAMQAVYDAHDYPRKWQNPVRRTRIQLLAISSELIWNIHRIHLQTPQILTNDRWMVKLTENPTLNTMTTAGMADNFISINVITPTNWIRVATALKTISTAAQPDNSKMPTQTNVAHKTHSIMSDKYILRSIYCSQKMNGIPDG